MRRLALCLASLVLLGCEMQKIQYRNTPVLSPKFVGESRFNEEIGKYEVEVTWQGLGEGSYEIHRKTIESDPYNYGGGGIRVVEMAKVYTSKPAENVFIDTGVQARLIYEYELLDLETHTFRVGPIRVYVYQDAIVTESLSDNYVVGGNDNRFGQLKVRGAVKVENWTDVFARLFVFEPGASLVFGNHPPPKHFQTVPKSDACIVRRLFAQRAQGTVTLTGIDTSCVEEGKTYQGNNFFLQIRDESPVQFVYGKGVNSKELPVYAQCILNGARKVLWSERCESFLPKK